MRVDWKPPHGPLHLEFLDHRARSGLASRHRLMQLAACASQARSSISLHSLRLLQPKQLEDRTTSHSSQERLRQVGPIWPVRGACLGANLQAQPPQPQGGARLHCLRARLGAILQAGQHRLSRIWLRTTPRSKSLGATLQAASTARTMWSAIPASGATALRVWDTQGHWPARPPHTPGPGGRLSQCWRCFGTAGLGYTGPLAGEAGAHPSP